MHEGKIINGTRAFLNPSHSGKVTLCQPFEVLNVVRPMLSGLIVLPWF